MLRKLTKLLLLTFLKNYIFNFRHQKTLKMPTKIHDELKVDDKLINQCSCQKAPTAAPQVVEGSQGRPHVVGGSHGYPQRLKSRLRKIAFLLDFVGGYQTSKSFAKLAMKLVNNSQFLQNCPKTLFPFFNFPVQAWFFWPNLETRGLQGIKTDNFVPLPIMMKTRRTKMKKK